MSTITPAVVRTGEDPALNERYLRLLQVYDGRAIRSKRWMVTLWNASMLLTWVPLLLAISALAYGVPEGRYHSLVSATLRWAGLTNAVVTIAQIVSVYRNRWLKYRAATERLRENCMRFRARLNRFCGDDAPQAFRAALDELENEVNDRRPFQLWDRIPWSYLVGLQPLPEKLRASLDHAPDMGLYPRCDEPETARSIVILERLRNQQRWHLLKARWYSRLYLLLQLGIVLLGLTTAVYHLQYGYEQLATLALFSMAVFDGNLVPHRLPRAPGLRSAVRALYAHCRDTGANRARIRSTEKGRYSEHGTAPRMATANGSARRARAGQ